jgi:hypothetical protein
MAKSKQEKEEVRRTLLYCPFYAGYVDEMPQDTKDLIKEKDLELYNSIFKD